MMLSTCACTDTSSAEVGSSHTRNSGCVASARAIEMRWRWPPENWCGNLCTSAAASPTACSSASTRARCSAAPAARPCSRSGSATMSSTFQRGFRLAYGSWKIICMRRRSARSRAGAASSAIVSWPSNSTWPRVGAYSPTSSRATVLLPQPDSPTSASVRPRPIEKLTPSTACTTWRGLRSSTRFSHGADTSKTLARSCTCTSGLPGIPSGCALRYSPLGRPGGLIGPAPRLRASRRRAWCRHRPVRGARAGSARRRAGSAG